MWYCYFTQLHADDFIIKRSIIYAGPCIYVTNNHISMYICVYICLNMCVYMFIYVYDEGKIGLGVHGVAVLEKCYARWNQVNQPW